MTTLLKSGNHKNPRLYTPHRRLSNYLDAKAADADVSLSLLVRSSSVLADVPRPDDFGSSAA
jgi:hypothetical protein